MPYFTSKPGKSARTGNAGPLGRLKGKANAESTLKQGGKGPKSSPSGKKK